MSGISLHSQFQVLIGILKTSLSLIPHFVFTGFQVLIGILKTIVSNDYINIETVFQVLIGILKTAFPGICVVCDMSVSSPYRYSKNAD